MFCMTADKERPCTSFAVTSAKPSEGKSLTAANIAISYAMLGKKVLLIDADMRKPTQRRLWRVEKPTGLCDFLAKISKLELDKVKDLPLWIVCTGTIPPNPSELLSSERMKHFVEESAKVYDYIIIDTPPINIQAKLAAGKGPGYERWAKVFNIKQMAAALAYIQDNNLTDYEQLAQKATEAADRFHAISEQVKQTEQAMKTNAGLKAATVQYAKTRPVFEQYKATKYSRKFLAEHEADLELYRAAQAEMRSLLGGAKLPKMDVLKEEGRKLTAKKKQLYGEYQKARRDMQEIVTIKANIDTLMGYTEPGRKQEKER